MTDTRDQVGYWRGTRQRLTGEFEQRRYLLDAALFYLDSTRLLLADDVNDDDIALATYCVRAAKQLVLRYDAHVCLSYESALDVITRCGGLLDRYATGELG